jgi:NTE family protein
MHLEVVYAISMHSFSQKWLEKRMDTAHTLFAIVSHPQAHPTIARMNQRRIFSIACAAAITLAAAGCKSLSPNPAPTPTPAPTAVPTPPPPAPPPRAMKIGLALGGGAARGFAHIGVIKVLEAQGIVPDIVVGTSAGSMVGALYASGMNGFQLQQVALNMDEAALADWTITGRGVLKGEALQNFVNTAVKNKPIEQFAKPFGAVATDWASGASITFSRGNAGQAVRASSSIPGVFSPVVIGSRSYVDGGLVSPVPALAAKKLGADFVIAVNISALPVPNEITSLPATLQQTIAIMGQVLNNEETRQHADITIRPAVDGVSAADFNAKNNLILQGEQAASAQLAEIRRKMEEAKKRLNLR